MILILKRLTSFLIGLILFYSCASQPALIKKSDGLFYKSEELFTGIDTLYHENGAIKTIRSVAKGKLDGVYMSYNDNEKLSIVQTYAKGQLNGMSMSYNENERLSMVQTYKDGIRDGRYWSDYGSIEVEGKYSSGLKTGFWRETHKNKDKRYFPSQSKDTNELVYIDEVVCGNYLSDMKEGLWLTYSISGSDSMLNSELNYSKGVREGDCIEYYFNGKIASYKQYEKGELNGNYIENYENGSKKYVSFWNYGKLNGIEKKWYPNSQIKTIRHWENGTRQGTNEGWYDNGMKMFYTKWLFNQKDGIETWWYEDGNTLSEEMFDYGQSRLTYYSKRMKTKIIWDKRGNIISEEPYKFSITVESQSADDNGGVLNNEFSEKKDSKIKPIPFDTLPKVIGFGGDNKLIDHLIYPDELNKSGIQGEIIADVYVHQCGAVTRLKIKKGLGNVLLHDVVLDAIERTRFIPGKYKDEIIGMWISIPFNFNFK